MDSVITPKIVTMREKVFKRRKVWSSLVPFLYSLFDWKLVSPQRRLELLRASKEQVKLADLAYQEMQQRYKAMRLTLFTFLTTFADIDALLEQYAQVLSPTLENEASFTHVPWHPDRERSFSLSGCHGTCAKNSARSGKATDNRCL